MTFLYGNKGLTFLCGMSCILWPNHEYGFPYISLIHNINNVYGIVVHISNNTNNQNVHKPWTIPWKRFTEGKINIKHEQTLNNELNVCLDWESHAEQVKYIQLETDALHLRYRWVYQYLAYRLICDIILQIGSLVCLKNNLTSTVHLTRRYQKFYTFSHCRALIIKRNTSYRVT